MTIFLDYNNLSSFGFSLLKNGHQLTVGIMSTNMTPEKAAAKSHCSHCTGCCEKEMPIEVPTVQPEAPIEAPTVQQVGMIADAEV